MNVGILGCASVAKKYVIEALKTTTEVEKVFIASRDEKKAQSTAKEFGIEFLFNSREICLHLRLESNSILKNKKPLEMTYMALFINI